MPHQTSAAGRLPSATPRRPPQARALNQPWPRRERVTGDGGSCSILHRRRGGNNRNTVTARVRRSVTRVTPCQRVSGGQTVPCRHTDTVSFSVTGLLQCQRVSGGQTVLCRHGHGVIQCHRSAPVSAGVRPHSVTVLVLCHRVTGPCVTVLVRRRALAGDDERKMVRSTPPWLCLVNTRVLWCCCMEDT